MSILIATYPLAGHVGPLRPIARELVARGHDVRWYTGLRFADTVRATGAEFVAMAPELDRAELPLDEEFPERAQLKGHRATQLAVDYGRHDTRTLAADAIEQLTRPVGVNRKWGA
ncbi:hypothetical protein OG474_04260 [Kribbella sp. NBC_01505]|uniref:glycosyltransferase n=1 Tax=Kribbella sp. NBC_01505 TaxID=2903580 RepID=UPI0038651566